MRGEDGKLRMEIFVLTIWSDLVWGRLSGVPTDWKRRRSSGVHRRGGSIGRWSSILRRHAHWPLPLSRLCMVVDVVGLSCKF